MEKDSIRSNVRNKYNQPQQMIKMLLVATMAALSIFFIYILYKYNPSTSGFYPPCPTKYLLGIKCPGCGSLRASHALLHGRVAEAWHLNPMLLLAIPFILLLLFTGIFRSHNRVMDLVYNKLNNRVSLIIIAFILLGWGILRNFL